MSELDTDIMYLKGVGPKRADLLKKELGVSTLGELIRLYPFRYIDRSTIQPIASSSQNLAYIQILGKVVSRTLLGPSSSLIDMSGE